LGGLTDQYSLKINSDSSMLGLALKVMANALYMMKWIH